MRALTEYLVALSDLVQAEARELRRGLFRLVVAAVLVVAAAAVALLGLGMLLYGLYHVLLDAGLGVSGAAVLSGAIFMAGAALLLGGATWLRR